MNIQRYVYIKNENMASSENIIKLKIGEQLSICMCVRCQIDEKSRQENSEWPIQYRLKCDKNGVLPKLIIIIIKLYFSYKEKWSFQSKSIKRQSKGTYDRL